jgi:benzoyl-CoA reductase/2-hydroxyglutaryl-CoA dehydratase subunit BcrC/BadD/HgdB
LISSAWLHGCHTFNVESSLVRRFVTEELGLEYLKLETDYSESDAGWIQTRIEAFPEIISGRMYSDSKSNCPPCRFAQ